MTCSLEAGNIVLNIGEANPGSKSAASGDILHDKLISELIRQHHFATVGQLMHGLVHNMNSPLQVLSIQVELLKKIMSEEGRILLDLRSLPLPSAEYEKSVKDLEKIRSTCISKIEQLEKEMERLQDLTSLIVERCTVPDESVMPSLVNLNEVVKREIDLLQADLFFKHKIQKSLDLATSSVSTPGNYLGFCQALDHVLRNAIEAVTDSDRREINIQTGFDGETAFLSVRDSGHGIPAAAQSKLFTPFFTTKPEPHAGLGLFLAKKILEPFGAIFKVESEPGMTQVKVFFTCKGREKKA